MFLWNIFVYVVFFSCSSTLDVAVNTRGIVQGSQSHDDVIHHVWYVCWGPHPSFPVRHRSHCGALQKNDERQKVGLWLLLYNYLITCKTAHSERSNWYLLTSKCCMISVCMHFHLVYQLLNPLLVTFYACFSHFSDIYTFIL